LKDLFPPGIDWAEQVFQTPLEAVNLWMGNESAISSMHKDPYENLFYVASGEKVFTLCPPSDVAFLYEHKEYQPGVFGVDDDDDDDNHHQWGVVATKPTTNEPSSSSSRVRWIAPDVSQLLRHGSSEYQHQTNRLLQRYPRLKYAHPMEVRVQAGELLYLPSLWFHRVTQSCETIGINYWYDMKFDSPLWCYFSFLQHLSHCDDDDDDE
jgi:jumonji domain-containing protein 7